MNYSTGSEHTIEAVTAGRLEQRQSPFQPFPGFAAGDGNQDKTPRLARGAGGVHPALRSSRATRRPVLSADSGAFSWRSCTAGRCRGQPALRARLQEDPESGLCLALQPRIPSAGSCATTNRNPGALLEMLETGPEGATRRLLRPQPPKVAGAGGGQGRS